MITCLGDMAVLQLAAGFQPRITCRTTSTRQASRIQRPNGTRQFGRLSLGNARLVRVNATEEVKAEGSSEEVDAEADDADAGQVQLQCAQSSFPVQHGCALVPPICHCIQQLGPGGFHPWKTHHNVSHETI